MFCKGHSLVWIGLCFVNLFTGLNRSFQGAFLTETKVCNWKFLFSWSVYLLVVLGIINQLIFCQHSNWCYRIELVLSSEKSAFMTIHIIIDCYNGSVSLSFVCTGLVFSLTFSSLFIAIEQKFLYVFGNKLGFNCALIMNLEVTGILVLA